MKFCLNIVKSTMFYFHIFRESKYTFTYALYKGVLTNYRAPFSKQANLLEQKHFNSLD